MASQATFGGINNYGLQLGVNHGSVTAQFLPPGKPHTEMRNVRRTSNFISASERPETPPSPLSTVPFRRDPDFIDRPILLDQLDEKCSAPASRVALVGLGGVG
jgi:hypothetical protein